MFDIRIVRGRVFTSAERDGDHPVVIVSASTARALWPNGGGVGETFRLEPDPSSASLPADAPLKAARVVTVVGVSRDVAGFRMTDVTQAGVFLPASVKTPHTSIAARVTGNVVLAQRTLVERLTRIDPTMGMIMTLRTLAGLESYFLQVAFWVALVLGGPP